MIEYLSSVNPIVLAFIGSFFTFLVTSLGSLAVLFIKNNKFVMDCTLAFSAGVMISASFWSLLNPGITIAEELNMCSWLISSLSFLVGGLFLFISDRIFDKVFYNKKTSFKRNILLVSSITIHNIPEGLAIGCAFGSLINNSDKVLFMGAVLLTVGIGLQNFPEGSAVSMPLLRDGVSKFKAFIIGSLSAIVEPISAVIGACLVVKVKVLLPFFLCFAAGAMIYVVVKELIPESQTNDRKNLITMFTLIGFVIMMILDVALG